MPVTLLELRTELGILLNDPNEVVYSVAQKNQAINFAISAVQDWADSWAQKPLTVSIAIPLVAGQELYPLPDDFRHVDKVTAVGDNGRIFRVQPILFSRSEDFDSSFSTTSTYPTAFYINGRQIGFVPASGLTGTATLYHTPAEAQLVNDGDTLTMPKWISNMIVFKAGSYCASMNGDIRQKEAFERDYMDIEMKKELTIAQWQRQEGQTVEGVDALIEAHLIHL